MREQVIERLSQLGRECTEEEYPLIDYATEQVSERIRNVCNREDVPEGLRYLAVDMVCGEYIKVKALAGEMDDAGITGALKAITEGDVKVEYATTGSSLDTLLQLLTRGEAELYRYRRFQWESK